MYAVYTEPLASRRKDEWRQKTEIKNRNEEDINERNNRVGEISFRRMRHENATIFHRCIYF